MMNRISGIVIVFSVSIILSCQDKMGPKCDNLLMLELQMKEASCSSADGAIIASAEGGVEPYEFSIDGISFQSSGEFSNLPIGNYTVMVKDKNKCSTTLTIDVQEANTISATYSTSPSGCGESNGSIIITSSGGTGTHKYSLNGATFKTSGSFFDLSSKKYSVIVKDDVGCSKLLTIQLPTGISYGAKIKNILTTKCATPNCHVAGGEGPINFTQFSEIQENADNIKRKTQDRSMPLKGSLTQQQIDEVACWVNDGAINN